MNIKKALSFSKFVIKYGLNGVRERMHYKNESLEFHRQHSLVNVRPGSVNGEISFSIIMPVYNVDLKWLHKAIDSIRSQIYGNWELCISDDSSEDKKLIRYLKTLATTNNIKVVFSKSNRGISAASNLAAEYASGNYFVFMDNDDVITKDALLELYYEIQNSDADILYSDQDQIDINDNHFNPLYKPDWSPDLLLSQMYIGHLLCVRAELFNSIGGFRSEFDGSQDYDLMLRLSELSPSIAHLDKILYSWRALPTSTAGNANAKPYSQTAGLQAVQDFISRKYEDGPNIKVEETDNYFVYDIKYAVQNDTVVSIIIPTKNHVLDLKNLIYDIQDKTHGINYEIIVMNNQSDEVDTLKYLSELKSQQLIKVIDADYPFNWSKLNNHGIKESKGNVIVCLNNDIAINDGLWLQRLAGDCQRKEIGVVGPLLLYPDGTIQHAGVVIGMGGWADHVFKGQKPEHYMSPYISPMVKRNVSAVTGACMAFSRSLYEELGGFDEGFIVCGSDVDFCLRALQKGYLNLYDPSVVLTHFESKTRDPKKVPEIDFRKSRDSYAPMLDKGDPFYNSNLDYMQAIPTIAKSERKATLRVNEYQIDEVRPIRFRIDKLNVKRLNLVLPSVNGKDVYGGISTALRFFNQLGTALGFKMRILVLDSKPLKSCIGDEFKEYTIVNPRSNSNSSKTIVSLCDRKSSTLAVSENDFFVFTIWWGAYCVQEAFRIQRNEGFYPNPFIYLIQDFEPGFYSWSSRYLLADSTYKCDFAQVAVFNSGLLKDYFDTSGYTFYKSYSFNPILNPKLREYLNSMPENIIKRKRILVYGRPSTDRNAFEIIVTSLRMWVDKCEDAVNWEIIAAGEEFDPVYLGKGLFLQNAGKLSISDYATMLAGTAIGISLMVSPHPSYPPLEMAAFGAKVITNSFSNKDLAYFSPNIMSLDLPLPSNIYKSLEECVNSYEGLAIKNNVDNNYSSDSIIEFPFIEDICKLIKYT